MLAPLSPNKMAAPTNTLLMGTAQRIIYILL